MNKRISNILILVSLAAWLALLVSLWILLCDSFALSSERYHAHHSSEFMQIINTQEGKTSANDFVIQYAERFAKTIEEYDSVEDIPNDSIPFHYSVLDKFANDISKKISARYTQEIEYAFILDEWGIIDSVNNYIPLQQSSSIKNKLIGNLTSLKGAFAQHSYSSAENGIYFHVKPYFKILDVDKLILKKIILQLFLSIFSFLLLTAIIIWLLKNIFRLARKRQEQIEFVDNIRQTFQTPLTTISVASASQMRYLAENNIDDARKMGSYVHAQTARLQQIADQLNKNASLDIKLSIKPRDISLSVLFQHCLEDMKIKYGHREVDVHISVVPEDLNLMADPFYFKTAILNILDNAFQYNEADEELHVEIHAFNTNKEVFIRISDNGIGLEHSELSKIAKKYYRPSQHSHIYGLGLGLYQAKQIVVAHHGRIQFQGDTTAGFTVEMVLPNE